MKDQDAGLLLKEMPTSSSEERFMNEIESTQETHSSRRFVMAAMIFSVAIVAGAASLAYGVVAGGRVEAELRQGDLLVQESARLFSAQKYDASVMKRMEAQKVAENVGRYRETQQTWTRAGGALIGISVIVLIFAWVRRRAKSKALNESLKDVA